MDRVVTFRRDQVGKAPISIVRRGNSQRKVDMMAAEALISIVVLFHDQITPRLAVNKLNIPLICSEPHIEDFAEQPCSVA